MPITDVSIVSFICSYRLGLVSILKVVRSFLLLSNSLVPRDILQLRNL